MTSYTTTDLNVMYQYDSYAHGINNVGTIVGIVETSPVTETAFQVDADGYAPISTPNAPFLDVQGVNDHGERVGAVSGSLISGTQGYSVDASGNQNTFEVPGSDSGSTIATAVNNEGTIIGNFRVNGQTFGFEQSGSDNVATVRGTWNAVQDNVTGINNGGTIVGTQLTIGSSNLEGFISVNGYATPIDVPASRQTIVTGINDAGQICGTYTDSTTGALHGFVETHGAFIPIDDPNADTTNGNGTTVVGINNGGTVVGNYTGLDTRTHPFAAALTAGGVGIADFIPVQNTPTSAPDASTAPGSAASVSLSDSLQPFTPVGPSS